MFPETPIYHRLIEELGDVPAQVRNDAQQVYTSLERVSFFAPQADSPPHHAADQTIPRHRSQKL